MVLSPTSFCGAPSHSSLSFSVLHASFQSDSSYDFLSAEEKECLLFLEETIGSLDTEADSGLSTDESEQDAAPQGLRALPITQPAPQGKRDRLGRHISQTQKTRTSLWLLCTLFALCSKGHRQKEQQPSSPCSWLQLRSCPGEEKGLLTSQLPLSFYEVSEAWEGKEFDQLPFSHTEILKRHDRRSGGGTRGVVGGCSGDTK